MFIQKKIKSCPLYLIQELKVFSGKLKFACREAKRRGQQREDEKGEKKVSEAR